MPKNCSAGTVTAASVEYISPLHIAAREKLHRISQRAAERGSRRGLRGFSSSCSIGRGGGRPPARRKAASASR